METGFGRVCENIKWRGRKYYGGLIAGLGYGLAIGFFAGGIFHGATISGEEGFFIVILSLIPLTLLAVGHTVVGRPEKTAAAGSAGTATTAEGENWEDDTSKPTVCPRCKKTLPEGETQCASCRWTYKSDAT